MDQTTVKKRVVGVDISLEATTYAIVDVRGNILAKGSFPTEDYPDISAYVTILSEKIIELVEANGGYELVRSVGISAPSGNFLTGSIVNSPNLPWKGVVPLGALLRDRLGLAVAVANNAYAIALGEHAFGCAHGMRDFIVITLGNGMGSCVFSNGVAHQGYEGFAGEVGHTCAIHGGRLCGCGNKGCLETYTAAKGILQTAWEVMAESSEPSLMRDAERLTPRIIASMCDQGDALAIEVYRRTGEMLGLGVANYASILNPEAIIFTGGIPKAGKWLLEPAYESFEAHVFHNIKGKVKFLTSELDDRERDVLGASVLAWEVKEYSLFKED
jgi:glucokinase